MVQGPGVNSPVVLPALQILTSSPFDLSIHISATTFPPLPDRADDEKEYTPAMVAVNLPGNCHYSCSCLLRLTTVDLFSKFGKLPMLLLKAYKGIAKRP